MTDLASLDLAAACDTPFEFELAHPSTGDGLGIFFSIVGQESASFQAYVREKANQARKRKFDKPGSDVMTVEEETEMTVDAVVACVKGWRTVEDGKSRPVIVWNKADLEFSDANARKLLGNPGYAWALRQIALQTAKLGNFIEG